MTRLLLALALSLPSCASVDDSGPDPTPPPSVAAAAASPADSASAGPVVVELFTSEGCSSCPPADALLLELAERPDVVALSFHVDYWDDLGWRDPYGSAAFTARQRAYARAITEGRGGVYTPQLVVGGLVGFVGSHRGEARTRIEAALARPPSATVGLTARRGSGRTVDVAYTTSGAPGASVVHLALVQREAESRVARGENRGRTLRHAHVVRAFETRADSAGHAALDIPDGLEPADMLAVAYVQRGATGEIYGAATADVE